MSSQADHLRAIVCKARPGNPSNEYDAEIAKEIFEAQNFERGAMGTPILCSQCKLSLKFPQPRRRLKTLQGDVARFLATLPQEHDPVGTFLKRTYTGEIFLKDQLRPTEKKSVQLEHAWLAKHGLPAIRNSLARFQKHIDAASCCRLGQSRET